MLLGERHLDLTAVGQPIEDRLEPGSSVPAIWSPMWSPTVAG